MRLTIFRHCFGSNAKKEAEIEDFVRYGFGNDLWVQRLYVYYIFARKFGWTPDEVDKQPAHIVKGLLKILSLETEEMKYEDVIRKFEIGGL